MASTDRTQHLTNTVSEPTDDPLGDFGEFQMDTFGVDMLSDLLDQDDEEEEEEEATAAASVASESHGRSSGDEQVSGLARGSGGQEQTFAHQPGDNGRRGARGHKMSINDRKARRRAQLASSAKRQRFRKKLELAALKTEEQALSQILETLACSRWKEVMIMERRKRLQAEEDNERLKQNLQVQSGVAQRFKALLNSSSEFRVDMNMCSFLHSHTYLPKGGLARTRTLEAVCTREKLELAARVLLSETGSIRPLATPAFTWKSLDLGTSGFGVTSIAVYSLDTADVSKAFKAARNAIATCGVIWPSYSLVSSSVRHFIVPSADFDISYSVTENRFQSSTSGDQVLLEGRDMSYSRVGSNGIVYLWDCVDDDELHPLKKTVAIKRSAVGALLVRPELCDDGVERIVCRYICSKTHQLQASELPPDIKRFSRSNRAGAQVADSLVYEAIKGDVSSSAVEIA
ncbi:Transportin-3 [Phytophthora boehmeriae]|uniref:Transportin-3 n=1 Tax=Phytophthora boehmeriae TaxID=109152 RepID=A0A8T1VMX7_9STRA|nr:Transportin-3 [Phytophthora boehmeriae]